MLDVEHIILYACITLLCLAVECRICLYRMTKWLYNFESRRKQVIQQIETIKQNRHRVKATGIAKPKTPPQKRDTKTVNIKTG